MKDARLATRVVTAIRTVIGDEAAVLHEPFFSGSERQYLNECIDTGYVSSVGAFVDRFEAELASYTGAKNAVAVVNGTAALHLAMRLAGTLPCDEVLVPALTFVATAAAVVHCGATPHFVDSEERTLGMDPRALRDYLRGLTEMRSGACFNKATGRRIKAMVPMHTFGHPADVGGLLAVARDFGLTLVEDAAESLGSFIGGQHTGTFGRIGTLSFNGNKTITTGGGGALLFTDIDLARRAKHLSTTAKVPHRWAFDHDAVGYNYRMPNLNAALGCAQLEQLPRFLSAKRALYERYQAAFAAIPEVTLVREPDGCRSNYWLQTLLLDEGSAAERDEILKLTNDGGLMTRPAWTLMHKLAPYADCPRMPLPVAESLERRIVNLPSSPQLLREPGLA